MRKRPRRLTLRECARLMGFPPSFKIPVSDTQAYKPFSQRGVYKHESEDLFCFEHIQDKPINFVWTIVESGIGDDGTWYASPGIHYVNRLGYVMTKKAWIDDTLDAIYFAGEFDPV
ncbi:DNA cytosine methyltransferase [Rudaea sp.]|uniref:DNA cytosine methyltransferase n=1 Tax=Rudaea sp. TaxID=2136325 RepID=UPI003784EF32